MKAVFFRFLSFQTLGFYLQYRFYTSNNAITLFIQQTKIFDELLKSLDFLFLLSYHDIFLTHYLLKQIRRDYNVSRLNIQKLRLAMLFDLYQSQILIIDLYVLILAVVAQVFNPIAELVISSGIPTKSRNAYTSSKCKSANKKIFIIIQSRTNLSVLLTHQFILLCFLNKIFVAPMFFNVNF